jgi:hypothetical protein
MPRFAQPTTKYHHIANVVLAAPTGSDPSALAAEVRRRDRRGVYEPVRICEDINHMIRRDGVFVPRNVPLTESEFAHLLRLREDMKRRGAWLSRGRGHQDP